MSDDMEVTGRFGRKNGVIRKPARVCNYCANKFDSWQKRKYCSIECRNESYKGRKVNQSISEEERERRRDRMTGENNPMWCGGDSDKERRNSAYKNWRISVFKRDGFTCVRCGYFNGCGELRRDLNAHHVVKWIDSIELRYEIDNGLTMCVPCHITEHTNRN